MTVVKTSIVIDAPREKVFDVIADFEKYPKFMKEMKKVLIDDKTGNTQTVTFDLELVKRIQYTLKCKLNRPTSISWTLVRGEMMRSNVGGWKLKKISEKKTEANYTIDITFGLFVPNAIGKALVESGLPDMMQSFKKKIESKK